MTNNSTDGTLVRCAPAKVNLFLHIVGRRADGYHELESLFAFTRGGDSIAVSASETVEFSLDGPFAGTLSSQGNSDNNLVVKAARLLKERYEVEQGANLSLTKNLPVAAGIGGGSADAAATLLALDEFWQLDLSSAELHEIALLLGADVPACLHAYPLFVSGIGDKVEPAEVPKSYGILLVNPGVPVSTPQVFGHYHETSNGYRPTLGKPKNDNSSEILDWLKEETVNDLEAPALELCPQIAEVLQTLRNVGSPAMVRMSGSGATCFALYDTDDQARSAQIELALENPGWWCFADSLQTA